MLIFFGSCVREEKVFFPKPRAYHRIDLPRHSYQNLQGKYPYTFAFSAYAKVFRDSTRRSEDWINVYYPAFEANINITYKDLGGSMDSLFAYAFSSHKLANKHQVKASAIYEQRFKSALGYEAVIIEIEGEVPSQFQFYLTDTIDHFLRAALYFNTATKNDSLAPIIDYIQKDMMHMIHTTEWK